MFCVTHTVVGAQAWVTNLPLTHCANLSPTQASSPVWHEEFSFSVLNLLLKRGNKGGVSDYFKHKEDNRRVVG